MALNFPGSPTPGQTYSLGSKTWTWNGSAWDLTSSKVGYTGSAGGGEGGGYTGSVGYTGSKGTDGIVGYNGSTGYTGSIGYTGSFPNVITDTSAPGSPTDGTLWWNSTTGQLLIYYDDGDSQQWVEANSGGYVGSQGYTGSTGIGYTGSASTTIGYTGSAGYLGSFGYTGSIGTGYTGSIGSVGYAGSQGVTGYFGSTFGYTGSIGDGSNTSYTITHGLNTSYVWTTVKELSSGYFVYPDIKYVASNQVVVEFTDAPTSNQYQIYVLGFVQ